MILHVMIEEKGKEKKTITGMTISAMNVFYFPSKIYFKFTYVARRLDLLQSTKTTALIYFHYLTPFFSHDQGKCTHYWMWICLCSGYWIMNAGFLTWPIMALQRDTVTAADFSARSRFQGRFSALVTKKWIDIDRVYGILAPFIYDIKLGQK